MKYYIIAGEASGDLHASNLIKALKKLDPKASFRAWGGDLMQSRGADIIKHYNELSFMGFAEVLMNLRTILSNMAFCKSDLRSFRPDVLILVDYPGFNIPIAKFAHKRGIKVHYYISPQVWAWKKGRVHTLKRVVDKMLVILPFEKAFYAGYDFDVNFVGHPLLDALENQTQPGKSFLAKNQLSEKPIIALLPGSRKQEISRMLSVMVEMVDAFPDHQFVVGAAPSVDTSFYAKYIQNKQVALVTNQTYALLQQATAALVTSGTATLETALFGVPEVVCYKGNRISFEIARRVVKVDYISLVNLVMKREVVKELIQDDFNPAKLEVELRNILENKNRREQLAKDYQELRDKLGGAGASAKAAEIIFGDLSSS